MVYNTQNYWVFGLRLSSGILETRKHNVSETGSVSVLRRWGRSILFRPLERANLNQWLGLRFALSKGPKRVGVSPLA
jgi:hypothetical protein